MKSNIVVSAKGIRVIAHVPMTIPLVPIALLIKCIMGRLVLSNASLPKNIKNPPSAMSETMFRKNVISTAPKYVASSLLNRLIPASMNALITANIMPSKRGVVVGNLMMKPAVFSNPYMLNGLYFLVEVC